VRPWLKFGAGSVIERECTVWCAAEVGSEPSVIIGAYCYIISGNHRFGVPDLPVRTQGYEGEPITIGRNVWLGAHVVVLPGVTIGDNAVVGAASVVTSSVPGAEIWAGVPARRIRSVVLNSCEE
jgi:acetyltransferase-like isoleucine patch superfamily enzyme